MLAARKEGEYATLVFNKLKIDGETFKANLTKNEVYKVSGVTKRGESEYSSAIGNTERSIGIVTKNTRTP